MAAAPERLFRGGAGQQDFAVAPLCSQDAPDTPCTSSTGSLPSSPSASCSSGSSSSSRSQEDTEGRCFLQEDLWKTRPCLWLLQHGGCRYGEDCVYAHSPEELRPLPPSQRAPDASHWRGAPMVSIGVVEHAVFGDPPPQGTVDVMCNRNTLLGNPFASRIYAEGEAPHEPDDQGWYPGEHQDVVAAFEEYMTAVLQPEAPEDLQGLVERISRERRTTVAQVWWALHPSRSDIVGSLDALGDLVASGSRLRLLCHCRPHVRCHTEVLKALLERRAPPGARPQEPDTRTQLQRAMDIWPGLKGPGPRCARCGRVGHVLDPGDLRRYCALCWSDYVYHVGRLCGKWD